MKRKMLFITFAFMFILLIFCSNSFASSELVVDDATYIMPDWWSEKEYRFFATKIYNDKQFAYLFASDYPFVLTVNSGNYYMSNTNNSDICWTSYNSSTHITDFSSKSFELNNTWSMMSSGTEDDYSYYSSHDLYYDDTLVFQAPVQETQEITLAQVLETEKENNPQMAMKEIIVIFPTILVVVVSYLGLRKALAMLSAILHRS